MSKQYIRLKQFSANLDKLYTPSESYLMHTDGSLKPEQYRLRTDNNGFIVTNNNYNSFDFPICFLGDSLVESLYSHEEERFCSIFERNLNFSGRTAKVLNAGYSGSTLLHLYNNLVNRIYHHLKGGDIYLFLPMSDVDYMDVDGGYWNITERGAPILPPMSVNNVSNSNRKPLAFFDSTTYILSLICHFCDYFGLRLNIILGIFRRDQFDNSRSGFDLRVKKRSMYNDSIREWAIRKNIYLIDLEKLSEINSCHFYDELHLNLDGHLIVANALTKEAINGSYR